MTAKEKLGDRNAEIIAESYGVAQWNPNKLNGLCPFHNESHPSFSYNRKDYSAHCFSCGESTDVIRALMDGDNLSFVDAAKKLFELAEMDVLWDKVHTDRKYRYPHEEGELTQDVIDYMALRGISEKTLRDCGIQSDGKGNMAFPYRDENGTLLTMKYRPARKIDKTKGERKHWAQADADTTPILFNMNRCNPDYPLVCTEGEIDCLAVYEAGYHNVVSIPNGAQGMQFLSQCYDWLDQYKEIILAGDADEAGQKFNKEASTRLGAWRCKTLDIPTSGISPFTQEEMRVTDCNEVLVCYGKEYLLNLIRNAHETPIQSVVDIMDVKPIDTSTMDGVETGILPLDRMLGKLYYSSVTLLSGKAGAGKSSFVSTIMCNAMDQGINVFLYSGELNAQTNRSWLDYIFAGPREVECCQTSNGGEYWRVKPEVTEQISKHYRGRCFLYKDGQTSDIDALLQSAEEVVRRYDCKVLVFDNLMTISTADSDEELVSQKEIMLKMVAFARKFDVAILTVVHLRKMARGQQATLEDISGSAKIGNLAARNLTLARVTDEDKAGAKDSQLPEDLRGYDVCITCSKERYRGKVGSVGTFYDPTCRRFYTNMDEYDKKYGWCKKKYEKPLPWPHGEVEQVIGPKQGGA